MSGLQSGIRVPPQSTSKIRQIAINTRQALGLPDGVIDIPRFLESLHTFGIVVDVFEEAAAPVGQGVEACWVPEASTLYVHERVYADACRGGPRATFTVAHELGHIVLAHRRTMNRASNSEIRPFENSEWQANTFASEFLMPVATIVKFGLHSPGAIARHFNVSVQAAEVRLRRLIDEQQKK